MRKIVVAVLVFYGLSQPLAAADDINAAARDVCKCLAVPYKKVEQAMRLILDAQASGDMNRIQSAQADMMNSISGASQCFEALTKKYPEIDHSDKLKQEVMQLADQQCPKPAAALHAPR